MSAVTTAESMQIAAAERKHRAEAHARAALRHSGYSELRRVECEYDAGIITLRGLLPSFYSLQVALSAVRSGIDGDVLIRNRLDVDIPQLEWENRKPR